MLFLIVQGGIFPRGTEEPASLEALFGLYPAQDAHDSKRVIVFVDQGGLGMGNRSYYLNDDEATRSTRSSYVSHVQRLLALAARAPGSRQSAERRLEIETMLARSWAENATRINPNNVYHAYSLQELQKLTPTFAWPQYFATLGIAPPSHYVVSNPAFLQEVERLLQVISLHDWQLYLRSQLLAAAAPLLNKDFADEDFDFSGKVLQGIERPSPRSVRCRNAVDRDLPDALGQEFVNAAFRPEDRLRVATMADMLQAAMREELLTSDWLDSATRGRPLRRSRFCGRESGIRSGGTTTPDSPSVAPDGRTVPPPRPVRISSTRRLRRIGGPPDLNEWSMTPMTIDAYANPRQLIITVPAAVIGPPNFDPQSDDPLNFGGIGALMGHEITHFFDTMGRHYDHHGNLVDWWTPKDTRAFAERAQCISNQYSEFVAVDDERVNGEQTSSENIADAGGLRIALIALRQVLDRQGPDPMIDGFSAVQRLFLGYGTFYCAHTTPEALRDVVSGDRHSPVKYRVNGVVSNMREFREAFSCKKGQAMVHEPVCRVW